MGNLNDLIATTTIIISDTPMIKIDDIIQILHNRDR